MRRRTASTRRRSKPSSPVISAACTPRRSRRARTARRRVRRPLRVGSSPTRRHVHGGPPHHFTDVEVIELTALCAMTLGQWSLLHRARRGGRRRRALLRERGRTVTLARAPATASSSPIHDLGGEGPPLLRARHRLWPVLHPDRRATRRHSPLLGTGPSGPRRQHHSCGRPLPLEGMADDLCAVLDALGIDEPVDFVGHSMGGATVIATELRRPGTIRTAWLFEPIVFPPMGDNPSTMSEVARNRRASFDTIEAVLERYGSPTVSAVDPAVLDDYVRHGFAVAGEVTLKCTPESEAHTVRKRRLRGLWAPRRYRCRHHRDCVDRWSATCDDRSDGGRRNRVGSPRHLGGRDPLRAVHPSGACAAEIRTNLR